MLDYYQKGEIVKEMGLTPLEHLEHFVDEIKKTIPLSSVWITRRKDMSKFSQTVSEQTFSNLPFLKGKDKEMVAEQAIPFTVVGVRGPVVKNQLDYTRRRMVETSTYYLDIEFNLNETIGTLEPNMTLSFAANFEGRDKKIEALREDLEAGETNTVLLTRSMLASGNDWYDLSVA